MMDRDRLFDLLALLVVIVLACMMTGCGAFVPVNVNKAVPIVCQEATPERPFMPTDGLQRGANTEQWIRAARAELLVRDGYEARLLVALQGCTKPLQETVK